MSEPLSRRPGQGMAGAFLLAQLADLAAWSRAPSLEANLVPGLAEPAEVVALKFAGTAALLFGAWTLARRGMTVAGQAVLWVGTGVGMAGALSALVALG